MHLQQLQEQRLQDELQQAHLRAARLAQDLHYVRVVNQDLAARMMSLKEEVLEQKARACAAERRERALLDRMSSTSYGGDTLEWAPPVTAERLDAWEGHAA